MYTCAAFVFSPAAHHTKSTCASKRIEQGCNSDDAQTPAHTHTQGCVCVCAQRYGHFSKAECQRESWVFFSPKELAARMGFYGCGKGCKPDGFVDPPPVCH